MAGSDPRKIPVVFYRTRGGGEIVRDWLRALGEKDRTPDEELALARKRKREFES